MKIKLFAKILILIFILLVLWGLVYFINGVVNPPLNIVIEFSELGPIYKRMPVYYKGYKIGVTQNIKPSDDYKTTLVTIKFYPHELILPNNTTAKVKPLTSTRDYIELIYPKTPSATLLKTGDKIQGSTTIDVQSFMNAQYESGSIGYIIENASLTLLSITKASNEAGTLMSTLNKTVNENRISAKNIMTNLDNTSNNLQELSQKLNTSVLQDDLNKTNESIGQTVQNIEELTKNMNKTITILNSTLCNINTAASDIGEITSDVKTSVANRNGLMRMFLGSKNDTYAKCAKKN